jgi:hypothetical protein
MRGFIETILTSFRTQLGTWLIGALIAILGVFSSWFTEQIKFGLNRADLRTTQHEELASEVSEHIFSAELTTEFIEHGWTTKQTMTDLLKDYNASITTLRKKEFVYLAWIHKYWGDAQVLKFKSFMSVVREFDSAIHSLNDEFEAVNISETKSKVDDQAGAEAVKKMKPIGENLRLKGRALLISLN